MADYPPNQVPSNRAPSNPADAGADAGDREPLVLLIPGFARGGASDWMQPWDHRRRDTRRLDLGMWDTPHRNTWVNRLNLAIHRAERPVVLVAHDIACLAVAWWAEYEQPALGDPVIGALAELHAKVELIRSIDPPPPDPPPAVSSIHDPDQQPPTV